jgi:hypothetical protein
LSGSASADHLNIFPPSAIVILFLAAVFCFVGEYIFSVVERQELDWLTRNFVALELSELAFNDKEKDD